MVTNTPAPIWTLAEPDVDELPTDGPSLTPTATPEYTLIVNFSGSPKEIDPGNPVTITWETIGDEATLCTVWSTGQLGDCEDVPVSGTRIFTTHESDRNLVQYTLFAHQNDLEETATISIIVRCPDRWFFDNPPNGCPSTPPITGDGAYQRFEHGLMIWSGPLDAIFVLFEDSISPYWVRGDDLWDSSMPLNDPSLEPRSELLQPIRGFGLVWRGENSNFSEVRNRIGWVNRSTGRLSM